MTEPCIYTKSENSVYSYIGVYVDDLVIAASTKKRTMDIVNLLRKRYSIKQPQPLSFILGVRIERDRDKQTITLTQNEYAWTVLRRFHMEMRNPAKTPADPATSGNDNEATGFPYREAVGSLMYLATCTKPDIAYAVSYLARNVACPTIENVNGIKRLLRYIRGTASTGITLGGTGLTLEAYADADFANDVKSRRSISGNLLMMVNGPVQWSSRRQPCIALSTVEAKYISLSSVAQTTVWMRGLLTELGEQQQSATKIHEDNQGAIALAKSSVIGRRSKHIDVRLHYVREQVENEIVTLKHCKSEDMLADILTKPLAAVAFTRFRAKICATPSRAREGVLENGDRASARPP